MVRSFITLNLIALAATVLSSCASPNGAANSTSGTKPYPLKECIVTDNDLESMGGSLSLVYEGQEVKFCCKPCVGKFKQNPTKYLAKLK
jgi:YHS domain-containing protein